MRLRTTSSDAILGSSGFEEMKASQKGLLLLLLMLASAAIAFFTKPVRIVVGAADRMDYEFIIPQRFGSWRIQTGNSIGVVNPQMKANLDRLYSQIVTRTYQDSLSGKTIMLSVAYGEEQNKQSQVHTPEACYPAQGFEIVSSRKGMMQTSMGAIPVKRVLAKASNRSEPITYWIRLGDSVVRGTFEQKIKTIQLGISGKVSDGLLFRVSSIGGDVEQAYQLQDKFVQELINATAPEFRRLLIGSNLAAE